MNLRYLFILAILGILSACQTPYVFEPMLEINSQVSSNGKIFIGNVFRPLLIDFDNQSSVEVPIPSTSGKTVGIDMTHDKLYSMTNSGEKIYRLNFDDLLWEFVMLHNVGVDILQFDQTGTDLYYSVSGYGEFNEKFDKINLQTGEVSDVVPAGIFGLFRLNVYTNDIAMTAPGEDDEYGGLYVQDHSTGERRLIQQTQEKGYNSMSNIHWIDQGSRLVFVDRGAGILYIWDRATDQLSSMSIDERVLKMAFSPDGTQVIYTLNRTNDVFIGDWDSDGNKFQVNAQLLVDLGKGEQANTLFWW